MVHVAGHVADHAEGRVVRHLMGHGVGHEADRAVDLVEDHEEGRRGCLAAPLVGREGVPAAVHEEVHQAGHAAGRGEVRGEVRGVVLEAGHAEGHGVGLSNTIAARTAQHTVSARFARPADAHDPGASHEHTRERTSWRSPSRHIHAIGTACARQERKATRTLSAELPSHAGCWI